MLDQRYDASTLRDLVIGSGLGFEDRGAHALKGSPRRMALVRCRFFSRLGEPSAFIQQKGTRVPQSCCVIETESLNLGTGIQVTRTGRCGAHPSTR